MEEFGYRPFSQILLPSLFLTQCGWEQCEPGHAFGPAVRDHFLIHYASRGSGILTKNGKEHRVRAGSGFVIFPSEVTCYKADDLDPWEYNWVGFSGTSAAQLLARAGITAATPVFCLAEGPGAVRSLIFGMYGAAARGGGQLRALAYLLEFLSLLEQAAPNGAEPLPETPQQGYVGKALAYIQALDGCEINVDSLSAYIGLNRSHLYRVFRAVLGVGPQQYLVGFRINRACRLLLETSDPVAEIAAQTGFSGPAFFSTEFRRRMGESPAAFRKKYSKIT